MNNTTIDSTSCHHQMYVHTHALADGKAHTGTFCSMEQLLISFEGLTRMSFKCQRRIRSADLNMAVV